MGDRIVVGALGDDAAARVAARELRDAGHEVVFVGGHQSVEHLVRTAVAEDAARLVVDTGVEELSGIEHALAELDAADIDVEQLV
jgi:methylmalonyl-CoA mutase, C-terminal domain